MSDESATTPFDSLNPEQRAVVEHGLDDVAGGVAPAPLLVLAGAGTGKTKALTYRAAGLIAAGIDPRRILLLTFTRKASEEMTRRTAAIHAEMSGGAPASGEIMWSGTFHSVANRILRLHANMLGLPDFTVSDRSDAEDLMNLVREDGGFAKHDSRFPKKKACLNLYSYTVNARCSLEETIAKRAPHCEEWTEDLKRLFKEYVREKQAQGVLDYDDLLLYWSQAMAHAEVGERIRSRFDCVLVDELQDTNTLQYSILQGLCPDGAGLTAVGDDAQSIYSFRAAAVSNILAFPERHPDARIVRLERNYRSVQPILAASNAVIELSPEGFEKSLRSERKSQQPPLLVTVDEEQDQAEFACRRILENRESGIDLSDQAVLVRSGHHSAQLEVELQRRNIPFVKQGGQKFVEAAHVKDVVAILKWAQNPRDSVSAVRALSLLPGVGSGTAKKMMTWLEGGGLAALPECPKVPKAARGDWDAFADVVSKLAIGGVPWHAQVGVIREWYDPQMERLYDRQQNRLGDLGQLEQLAATFPDRATFLTEAALDPPESAEGEDGPEDDEDPLTISTIHSAKGREWKAVTVLNVTDGCIPSERSFSDDASIEEERRLLYVAMTRAMDELVLVQPARFVGRSRQAGAFAQRSRFIWDELLDLFEQKAYRRGRLRDPEPMESDAFCDVGAGLLSMWDD